MCLRLTVLWEMQIQALCVEGTFGVPGSVLVLSVSSRFLVVCGSVLVPGGPLANSSRFLAICEINKHRCPNRTQNKKNGVLRVSKPF